MNAEELVQPIVVLRTATHEDAVAAVAVASVVAYAATETDESWATWLSGRFTKTVRRAKKASELDALGDVAAADITVGSARAVALKPTRYENLDRRVARLQVSGTELERVGFAPVQPGVVVVVNRSLEMTTGKTAAQAAHALFAHFLTRRDELPDFAATRAVSFLDASADEIAEMAPYATAVIRDAGLTEIEPNSLTALTVVALD